MFFFSSGMDTKFLKSLKVYSLNSFIYSCVDLTTITLYFCLNDSVYRFKYLDFYTSYSFVFFYAYIHNILWTLCYTFSGLMDIYIVYGKIQVLKPSYKFLKKTSVKFWKWHYFYSTRLDICLFFYTPKLKVLDNLTLILVIIYLLILFYLTLNSYF